MSRKYQAAREMLESVEEGRLQVACLRREIRYLESRCTSTTQSYSARGCGSKDVHPVQWDQLAEKRELLARQEQEQQCREMDVARQINRLPNARWRLVLQCKYLQGMDLPEVTEEMSRATGCSITINQIYRYHHKALENLQNEIST